MAALLIVVFAVVYSFKDQGLGFACGGSGSLFKTQDGGKSWKRDKVHSTGWPDVSSTVQATACRRSDTVRLQERWRRRVAVCCLPKA